ncbi:MAG: Oligoendopeptidase F, plasmid [Chlamydiia bacterium]|nr:Oligoendopeptidase F, plasmid [Chlamydiia bacterium]MCH9615897.1 Oligoendopeptidase F, plasmid [Chlamydiia bacterium]MCH9628700.1 Oligoendopeptidase F, plasmid [Chlamydiia bacterium]
MVKKRADVTNDLKWDLSPLYEKLEDWEKDFTDEWPDLSPRDLTTGLEEFLDVYFSVQERLYRLYTYSHLKHDEDVADEVWKGIHDRAMMKVHGFSQETAWVEPAILELEGPTSEKYKMYLDRVRILKPYTLEKDKEELIALAGQALDSSHKSFGIFNNADLKFEPVGKDELTHGSYQVFLQSKDRKIRKEAFKKIHKEYQAYENTFTELLSGQIQAHLFNVRARGFDSCLQAALMPNQIDTRVYTSLVEGVRGNIQGLQDYVSLRKEKLGFESIGAYDMYVPLIDDVDKKYSIDEAKQLVIDSVAPLGEEYQETLARGLNQERWVDWLETDRKRSGAYSSGCYGSHPYMLMNFHGTLRDVFTLAHEAGHSMHTHLSHTNQPYHTSSYPIFLAEVASTYNEELLFRHLLNMADDEDERLYLINQKIDDMRATFFRQTLFAEFELTLHELAEKQVPFAASLLKEKYGELNKAYYGPDFIVDDEISVEFLRVPHFYYNFYVYQYATGIAAATALHEVGDQKSYLKFLSSGSSGYPLDLLKEAGVDMTSDMPALAMIKTFEQWTEELKCLKK